MQLIFFGQSQGVDELLRIDDNPLKLTQKKLKIVKIGGVNRTPVCL